MLTEFTPAAALMTEPMSAQGPDEAPNTTSAPVVHEMPAAEFAAQFPPSLWSDSWEHLGELADEYVEEPTDEDEWEMMGAHFSWGGECGWTVDALVESLSAEPMHQPVEVLHGHVTDGHHRVVAALRAGATVRFFYL